MGTSGSGRLANYSPALEENVCENVIEKELLENYGDYEYFKKALPLISVGNNIILKPEARIVAYDMSTGLSLGALSTQYEKIRRCFAQGYAFRGKVVEANNDGGIISIYVTIIGTKAKK